MPPAAIQAIRAPKTFAKIEITAAYRLKGHARRLYAALADKKHMGQTGNAKTAVEHTANISIGRKPKGFDKGGWRLPY